MQQAAHGPDLGGRWGMSGCAQPGWALASPHEVSFRLQLEAPGEQSSDASMRRPRGVRGGAGGGGPEEQGRVEQPPLSYHKPLPDGSPRDRLRCAWCSGEFGHTEHVVPGGTGKWRPPRPALCRGCPPPGARCSAMPVALAAAFSGRGPGGQAWPSGRGGGSLLACTATGGPRSIPLSPRPSAVPCARPGALGHAGAESGVRAVLLTRPRPGGRWWGQAGQMPVQRP